MTIIIDSCYKSAVFQLSDYDYSLPEELIATEPIAARDESRLLVVNRKTGEITHSNFKNLSQFLEANTVCVANNTQVLRARLKGNRLLPDGALGGKTEFLMLEKKSELRWQGIAHSAARQNIGLTFSFPTPSGENLTAVIVRGTRDSNDGTIEVEFNRDPVSSGAGELPLPHYMNRTPTSSDESTYQTVYAKNLGSAAAPTAGLHFTKRVIDDLKNKKIGWNEVTLHVGLGTFRPVQANDIREHKMHEEAYFIDEPTARELNTAKQNHKKILAVGTTSMRTLESSASLSATPHQIIPGTSRTSIFIYPGYEFKFVDQMITNFHLPKSTLLMLVSAFAGRDLILRAYHEAIAEKYRFFSYGDAMLIL